MTQVIRPDELAVRDRYKLLTGCIGPRPIAVVSTVSPRGELNLAPFSFFNGLGSDPMTVTFCPANAPDGAEKDTLRNCRPREEGGTGEFVVNLALESNIRRVVACAEPLPPGESEFELSGLTPLASTVVAPPRVAESPVAFECETLQVLRTNPGAPAGGNLVVGRVVCVHLADGLFDEHFHIQRGALPVVGRLGGFDYCLTRERFALHPGPGALEEPVDVELGE
jgi:flavin reductase (DIM6/NTAB) family NADH-FMN oxidoreductase RutF